MEMKIDKQRILVVDDEKEITDLVGIYLQNAGFDVIKCYNGADALAYLKRVALAVLDIMLPDIDGFSLCEKIREEHFFPIIMLTAKIEEADKIKGIVLGADDYITKPFLPMELLARVKGQLRRAGAYNQALSIGQPETRELYDIHGLEIDGDKHICRLYGEKIELTGTEFSIMLYLCRHMNQVVTSEEIFEHVWKEKYLDNNNTVFVHIARIREKLHENARKPKFIKTVWGVGYKLEDEEVHHV